MSDKENPDDPDEVDGRSKKGESKLMDVVLVDSDDEKGEKNKIKEVPSNNDEGVTVMSDESIEEVVEELPPRKKLIVVRQCLNPECTVSRKEQLVTADQYTCSYFGLSWEVTRKRKVCLACSTKVRGEQERLVARMKDNQSLFSSPLPVPKEMVILEDSDEEPETDSSGDSEFEVDISTDSSEGDEGVGGSVEDRLNSIIEKTLNKFNLDFQVKSAAKDLTERLNATKDDFDETDKLFTELEGKVDGLRKELYKDYEPRIKELPPIDLNRAEAMPNSGKSMATKSVTQVPGKVSTVMCTVPPPGILERPNLVVGQEALAMKQSILQVWKSGKVEEILEREGADGALVKLRFETILGGKKNVQSKVLSLHHLAYPTPAEVRLPVGTRCIGLYKENPEQLGAFYSGIVAEPPKAINRNRYLVFFDDGYASYIPHDEVRVVCRCSDNVWEDIHPNSKEFIKKYLEQYPERPMVKLGVGQVVKTEWDGKWWITRVVQVDASLVKLVFDADKRNEWIYRGSTRLGPLFTEMEQQRLRKQEQGSVTASGGVVPATFSRRQTSSQAKRRNVPYVEYRRDAADPEPRSGGQQPAGAVDRDGAPTKRAVARKSTAASKKTEFQQQQEGTGVRWENEGRTSPVDLKLNGVRKGLMNFKPHACSSICTSEYPYIESEHKLLNNLLVPIALGWQRQLSKHKQGGRRKVSYAAPCGRRLRSLAEVHRYICLTKCELEMDFFNFDWWLHVFNEFKPGREFCTIKDLSYGKENVPVSCVNSIDRNYPEYVEYSTVRLPQKNVNINTDPNYLHSCDCTDDCQNKDKCSCQQLTIKSTACDRDNVVDVNAGYKFRRLPDIVLTGIYECNPNCKCAKTCLNRVVQKPMRANLQVFKTEKRGWGIRTLYDMPSGTFICVYVGNLFESEEANKQGQNFGDEYFAELDMIEVVEKRKDGYESDVSDEGFNDDDHHDVSGLASASEASSRLLDQLGYRFTSEDNSTEEEDGPRSKTGDKDFIPDPRRIKKGEVLDWGTERGSRRRGLSQLDGAVSETESEGGPRRSSRSLAKTQLDGTLGDTADEGSDGADILEPQTPTRRGGFSATVGIAGPKSKKAQQKTTRFVSTRKHFGRKEDVYIMDAKSIGNIGRYLNHSCNPNVFVQNVFVDTHDLRFPWVAFFTSTFVRAGGELCWDYNYEVGAIPGKELYCSCGTEYCRGKLL